MRILNLFNKKNKDTFNSSVSPSILKEYNAQRANNKNGALCFAPFVNMYFSRHGDVFVCCHNRNYSIGKYPDNSITDIWNSKKADNLRQHLKNNNLSLGCQVCQLDLEKKFYNEVRANHFDQLPINSKYPTMMEFELDITCNLECTMCSGEFSSSIRKNREKIAPFKPIYSDDFVEQLKDFIPYLSETRFSGGEPFLIPIYIKIWEAIVEINPSCLISLQTNGTVLNNRVRRVLEMGRFEVGVSLDSLNKETFESIRKNSKFETVMSSIDFFESYCKSKKTIFRLSMCVMRNNWKEVPEFLAFCNSKEAYMSLHKVNNPVELGIRYLSSSELKEIYEYMQSAKIDAANETFIEKQNLIHYNNYVQQIKVWASIQSENEKLYDLSFKELKAEFLLKFENVPSFIKNKMEHLLTHYTIASQKELITQLLQVDFLILQERIKSHTINELKLEVLKLFEIQSFSEDD